MNNGPLKGHAYNFTPLCINHSTTSLFLSPHLKYFILGIDVRSYLIFEMIWVGTVDLSGYRRVGAGLDHSGDEKYFQNLC